MDIALRAALTASLITVLILAANWLGDYASGLLSGLPFTTIPALLLIGLDHGRGAAADAAIGGITGCALTSVFALAYDVAARRLPPAAALAVSVACLSAGLFVASQMPLSLLVAGCITCAAAAGALLLIRTEPLGMGAARKPNRVWRAAGSALAIGLGGAAVTTFVLMLSPTIAGIVAAMPILGVASAATTHATRGRAALPPYLRGYVISSLAKMAFCIVFATCALPHGMAVALIAACASGGMVCVVAGRFRAGRRVPATPRNVS